MDLFNVTDEVYPQLVRLFYANFEIVEPKGRGRTYYMTKVKDNFITLTTASSERIFDFNPDLSKFSRSIAATKFP